jgi:hypothetical protein
MTESNFFRVMAPPAWRATPSVLAQAYMKARRLGASGKRAADVLGALRRTPPKAPAYVGCFSFFRPGQPVKVRGPGDEWNGEGDGSDMFREVRSADRYYRGDCDYYRATEYEDESEGRHPRVARVRGGWIAGYETPASEWSTWATGSIYGDESDASRAAHSMARNAAEQESEYQDGWQKGREARERWNERMAGAVDCMKRARDRREEAREAMRAALAMREGERAGFVPPAEVAAIRDRYRVSLESARAEMETARELQGEAREAFRLARPWKGRSATYERDPDCAGFWQAWDEG